MHIPIQLDELLPQLISKWSNHCSLNWQFIDKKTSWCLPIYTWFYLYGCHLGKDSVSSPNRIYKMVRVSILRAIQGKEITSIHRTSGYFQKNNHEKKSGITTYIQESLGCFHISSLDQVKEVGFVLLEVSEWYATSSSFQVLNIRGVLVTSTSSSSLIAYHPCQGSSSYKSRKSRIFSLRNKILDWHCKELLKKMS